MAVPESFQSMLKDPAPGLVFQANAPVGIGRRAYATPHIVRDGAGWVARRKLRSLVRANEEVLRPVLDFYEAHDGLSLCAWRDLVSSDLIAALSFLPISAWDAATQAAMFNDDGGLFEGLGEIYRPDAFRVFATSPTEGTALAVLLEDGEHPQAKAGCIYYLSMRPVYERTLPLASDFGALLERIAVNPAGFLYLIGFTGRVKGADGQVHADSLEAYVGDVREHPALVQR